MLATVEGWGAGADERPYLPRAFSYLRAVDGELHFMLENAEPIILGALERKESRGAQFRTDYPERKDEEWLKHIVITREGDDDVLSLQVGGRRQVTARTEARVMRLHAKVLAGTVAPERVLQPACCRCGACCSRPP